MPAALFWSRRLPGAFFPGGRLPAGRFLDLRVAWAGGTWLRGDRINGLGCPATTGSLFGPIGLGCGGRPTRRRLPAIRGYRGGLAGVVLVFALVFTLVGQLGGDIRDEFACELWLGGKFANGDVIDNPRHEGVPGIGGLHAAAAGLPVFVVTKPNRRGELGNRTDEPQVTAPLGGAGLARHRPIGETRRAASTSANHVSQHVRHGVSHIAADSATGGLGLLASTPDQGAIGAINQIEWRRCHIQATVINRRVGGRHFKNVFLIRPQHHGRVFPYLAGDPKLAGHADYPGITHLFGRSHGGGID